MHTPHLHMLLQSYLLINGYVRYDTTNTSTPSKRRNVFAANGAFDHNSTEHDRA